MAKETRPDYTYKWASTGSTTSPTTGKISLGWIVEKPSMQYWNWLENRQDQAIAYLMQQGIAEWNSTIEYQSGSSFITYDGNLYKSIQTGTNKQPDTEPTYWEVVGGGLDLTGNPFSYIEPAVGLVFRPTTATAPGVYVFAPEPSGGTSSAELDILDRNDLSNNLAFILRSSASAGYASINVNGNGTVSDADLKIQCNSNDGLVIKPDGKVGVNTTSPTSKLDINDNVVRVRTAKTPASASDTGNAGDICWDSDYVYVCVATNTWKRSAIATW